MRRSVRVTALAVITSALVLGPATAASADTPPDRDPLPTDSLLGGLGLGGVTDTVSTLVDSLGCDGTASLLSSAGSGITADTVSYLLDLVGCTDADSGLPLPDLDSLLGIDADSDPYLLDMPFDLPLR